MLDLEQVGAAVQDGERLGIVPQPARRDEDGGRNVFPHQVYSLDEMKEDRQFGPVIEEYESRLKTFEKEKNDLNKSLEEKEKALKDLESVDLKRKAGDVFRELIKDSTGKQKAYLERRFEKASLNDWSEQAIKDFLEASKADFAEDAKLFSESQSAPAGNGTHEGGDWEENTDPVSAALAEIGVK